MEDYKDLTEKLLICMNESDITRKNISNQLDERKVKEIHKISRIINKIIYSTSKLYSNCYICGNNYNKDKLYNYKKLNTEELVKLNNNINTYINNTEDYNIEINIFYLLLCLLFSIVIPCYIALYNMYLIQLINTSILLFLVYPSIYIIYQYRSCPEHNKYYSSNSTLDTLRNLLNGIKKQPAANKPIWSCKYANKLANYIISQTDSK